MRQHHEDLQLFIDLGFILLAAFFMLTEQSVLLQVPLPGDDDDQQVASEAERQAVYEVHFDERMQVVVLRQPGDVFYCSSASDMAQLEVCLLRLHSESPNSLLVLSPQGAATLQQLVSLLDFCLEHSWESTTSRAEGQ